MKKILILAFAILLFVAFSTKVSAEQTGMMKSLTKQVNDVTKKLSKKFKFDVSYKFEPNTITDLQFVFGLCSKSLALFEEKGKIDWKKKLKGLKGISILITKGEKFKETKEYDIAEQTALKTLKYNPQKNDFEKLIFDLTSEKKIYFELSGIVKKLKIKLVMDEGVSWSDSAVLIRMFQNLAKESSKTKKILKKYTFMSSLAKVKAPDFSKKLVPICFKIEKEVFLNRLEHVELEYSAYQKSTKLFAKLSKMGVRIEVHSKFSETFFEFLWRKILPLTEEIERLTKVEVNLGRMIKKPIIFSPASSVETETDYIISVYEKIEKLASMFGNKPK